MSMSDYCKKPWKRWRASLIHTYFRNPWAIVSLVAAFFVFALTIAQTVYSAGQFYQSLSPTNNSPPILPVTPRPHASKYFNYFVRRFVPIVILNMSNILLTSIAFEQHAA
ncbi:hypothetical protein RYX36_005987 [Vicia faba]